MILTDSYHLNSYVYEAELRVNLDLGADGSQARK